MQDNISPDAAAQDKAANEVNQAAEVLSSADVTALDAGEIPDSASHNESQSPNVSGSSDMISGTPPKPSSRRQSFITLEKYGEGRPANSPNVKKFTGPLSRTSCSQEPPKSQNDSKLLPLLPYSQPESGKEVSKESAANITQDSTNQADGQNKEVKAELPSVVKCPSEGTEDEDDVIPDTQTQELDEVDDTGNRSSDKPSVDMNTEIVSPGGESEVFTASQDSSQVEPRRSGRRRSRPVLPGEESDQESKSKQQKKASVNASTSNNSPKSTPGKKTDILPTRTRRSRVHGENMSESSKLQNSEQKDSQKPSLSTTTSSLQGRRSRSKEVHQTEPSVEKQSPLSQTDDNRESPLNQSDSQSHSRPVRRTRITNTNVEVPDKKQRVENSQGDSPVGVAKQVDSSASDTDSQSPGRPRRTRRSEAQNKDKPGLKNEQGSDPSPAQTPTSSKGKIGRRKRPEGEMSNLSKDTTLSGAATSECSQGNEISELQDNSQGRGKYRTRLSSQALLASVEPSEPDSSDTRDDHRPKRAKGQKSSSEVIPDTVMNETSLADMLGKEDADMPPVQMDVSKNESEACLDVSILTEVQDVHKADDKEDGSVVEGQAIEHYTSDVKSADEQQSYKDSKMQVDSDKEESVNTVLDERGVEKETLPSSQNSLQLPAKVELKAPELHTCPHSKRGRGRRRSTNCNCLQVRGTPSKEQETNSQVSQDLKENEGLPEPSSLPTEPSSLPPEAELNSIPSLVSEKESVALQDNCPDVANVQSSPSLHSLTEAEVPVESPEEKQVKNISQSSEVNERTNQAEQQHKDNVGDNDDKPEEMERDKMSSENTFRQEQLQEDPSAPDATLSHSQPVEDKPVCQEQSESPVSQEEIVHSAEKTEMPEKGELVPELDGAVTALPEGTELDRTPHEEVDDGEATQLDEDLQPETAPLCEASEPPGTAAVETCLDSPPKQKSSDSLGRSSEVRQSPSSSLTRGVWSPSASPSTSILKKGQKRQCEEDSPSPLVKVVFLGLDV